MYDKNCDWRSYQKEISPEEVAVMFSDERNAHLPVFATDELHRNARFNGGDLEKAWADSELCGKHHEDKKELMFARVRRWLDGK